MTERKLTSKTIEYGNKPKRLVMACPHCDNKFEYVFQNNTHYEWLKELDGIVCPQCHKKRS